MNEKELLENKIKELNLEVENLNFWIRRIMRQKTEEKRKDVFDKGKHLLRKSVVLRRSP